jgi:RHS repeat-associated protein
MGDYALTYDAENRLTQVDKTVSGVTTTVALFTFDGDGKRVKSIAGSETTLFVGSQYEVTNGNATKYYFAGSQRTPALAAGASVALRSCTGGTCSAPTYLAGDHLGSTSLVTDASGALITKTLYKPSGEVRYNTPNTTLSTRYTYTGQYSYISDDATDLGSNGFGLMYYGARMYDPALSRFSSADTIVPGVGTSQAWDRYAYGMNNPLRYIDPTGHESKCVEYDDDDNCTKYEDDSVVSDPTATTSQSDDNNTECNQALLLCIWYRIIGGPDYGALTVNFPIPFISEATAYFVSGTVSVTASYGHVYVAPGVNLGKSEPLVGIPASASLSGGYLIQPSRASSEQMHSFLTGFAINLSGGYIVGGGGTWGNVGKTSASDFALEGGIYSPQIGLTGTYTLWDIDTNTGNTTWNP